MIKDIGSEYWEKEKTQKLNNLEYFNLGKDIKYLMLGRTAIDYILKNIEDDMKIVYMPNYCCESMVKPFLDNKYVIKYYNVDLINKKYDINYHEKCSIFFAMNYFGYSETNMDEHINKMKSKGVITIEDITHRLFQSQRYCTKSDYLIASLRKWFPIYSGAIAVNINNKFKINIDNYTIDQKYIKDKKNAMNLKKKYMNNEIKDKTEFLKLFEDSDKKISNYMMKKIDQESLEIIKEIDIDDMIKKRRKNAEIINNMCKKNSNIKILLELSTDDCPLFVPILLSDRERIKAELIKNDIYCPSHWQNFANIENDIYKHELSLICDQRYNEDDIKQYINKLLEIVGE